MKKGIWTVAIAVLFLLTFDVWFWGSLSRVFGMPVGLAYHAGLCLIMPFVFRKWWNARQGNQA